MARLRLWHSAGPTSLEGVSLAGPVLAYLEASNAVRAGSLTAIPSGLEGEFVAVAGRYSRAHAISARAWLMVGVSAVILEAAGILF